jgi:3-oxoacyl-[acyl-carrier-protein] synthase-1
MTAALTQPLAISAMGAVSAVGATAVQTCTSIRAGLAGFSEHPFFESLSHDPEWEPGEPLLSAAYPALDPFVQGRDRLLELAVPALIELGRKAQLRRDDLQASALLVALPSLDDSVQTWNLDDSFVSQLCQVTGLTDFELVRCNHSGHTGMFELVNDAHQILNSGQCQFCFVLGIDSYLSPDRLALWDETWRLRSERNADGFIPGEAASGLLLELPSHAQARSAEVLASIDALGFGVEASPLLGEESSSGAGLCEVLRDVIPPGESARWVCCDLNGESYRAFEWGLAQVRMAAAFEATMLLHHPADCIGDVGAATGGVLMSHAAHCFARSDTLPSNAVLWTSADDGKRAAMRITAAPAA